MLLVHGWGGRDGQLASFVAPLVARGWSPVMLDFPGHGDSPGLRTSLPEMARIIVALAREIGRPRGVIAHSLGAAAATIALGGGLALERAVLIGAPTEVGPYFHGFVGRYGRPHDVQRLERRIERRIERRLGMRFAELSLPQRVRGLDLPALVIHDRVDTEVPYAEAERLVEAWPGARLLTTTGFGHWKILRQPEVVERAVSFVSDSSQAVPASAH